MTNQQKTADSKKPMVFRSFNEFYPFYLSQHQNTVCKHLHVTGIIAAMIVLISALATQQYGWGLLAPVVGYGCSWTGHFVFEKNKPATFGYPLYSLMGDFKMTWEALFHKKEVRGQ